MQIQIQVKKFWNNAIANIKNKYNSLNLTEADTHNISAPLVDTVTSAREEWLEAKKFFDEVTDPALIDHAIYRIESAERKYMYLLNLAQKEQTTNEKILLM